MQQRILDGLVLRKLVESAWTDANYRVSDAAVLAECQNDPAVPGSGWQVRSRHRARGARAEQPVRKPSSSRRRARNCCINQLQQGIGGSYFLTRGEQQRLFNLENEEREVQYAQFAADKFVGTDPIDDAAIKAYYDKNGDRFMTTESVALEFAELRLEQLATQVAPTDADLQKLYDENRAMYVLDERRRARHIVIAVEW